jgi:rare lipoprotein A
VLVVAGVALGVANCASPDKVASGRSVDPKYGVSASPRVVADGDPVPKGGGRELVGRPYVIAGRTYTPQDTRGYSREGLASWYGTAFHGRLTANGEVFDRYSIAAAHPTLPLPSYARVTNIRNHRSMIVRVNDRGPYHADRIMDVSERVAEALDFKRTGTAQVRVQYVGKASLRGSDDEKLLATLREDGKPVPGMTPPIMVAERGRPASPARREMLAFNSADLTEAPDGGAEEVSARAPASEPLRITPPLRAASLETTELPLPTARPVANVPLPPERPLDLGTIPGAGTPVRGKAVPVAQLPPPRATLAAQFFAEPDLRGPRLSKDDVTKDIKPQRFVALKGQP